MDGTAPEPVDGKARSRVTDFNEKEREEIETSFRKLFRQIVASFFLPGIAHLLLVAISVPAWK